MWIKLNNNQIPDRAKVKSKLKYKIYVDLGISHQFMVRCFTVLDTGTGLNSILECLLPPQVRSGTSIETVQDDANANNNQLKTIGTIEVVLHLGTSVARINMVSTSLPAPVVLECDYFDSFVDATRPRLKRIELYDGFSILVVCRPLTCVM